MPALMLTPAATIVVTGAAHLPHWFQPVLELTLLGVPTDCAYLAFLSAINLLC
jgi:hypothetical protein|eukprot:COSAG02_NODE_9932_length_2071_cov_1.427992_3_plen_53_part_00